MGRGKGQGGSKDWLLVTAHYDRLGMMGPALFPGANDNASGVSMLLSLAAWFKKHPAKTNILFVAFAGEEVSERQRMVRGGPPAGHGPHPHGGEFGSEWHR